MRRLLELCQSRNLVKKVLFRQSFNNFCSEWFSLKWNGSKLRIRSLTQKETGAYVCVGRNHKQQYVRVTGYVKLDVKFQEGKCSGSLKIFSFSLAS